MVRPPGQLARDISRSELVGQDAGRFLRLESPQAPETRSQPSGASRFRGLVGVPQHAICGRPRPTGTSHIREPSAKPAVVQADEERPIAPGVSSLRRSSVQRPGRPQSLTRTSSLSIWGLCISSLLLPREPDTQIRRSRVVGADTRPCLRRRGAPCPVSRTSGPRADCSSVLVQSPPPWLLARRRGLFGFGPLSQYWPRLVAPVLDTPSVSHSRAKSYKYALPLYLVARELMPSVLPYSWSTTYIHQLDRLLRRQEAL